MARMTKKEREAKREREVKIKNDREVKLIKELEANHGYMFAEIKEDARRTMHFSRSRKTGKYALVAARVLRVSMPEDSWLARWANAHEEEARKAREARAKEAKRTKAKASAVKACVAKETIAAKATPSGRHARRG